MKRESLDLANFIQEYALEAEIVAPGVPVPTVATVAAAMRVAREQIFKSILVTQDSQGR